MVRDQKFQFFSSTELSVRIACSIPDFMNLMKQSCGFDLIFGRVYLVSHAWILP